MEEMVIECKPNYSYSSMKRLIDSRTDSLATGVGGVEFCQVTRPSGELG